MIQEGIFILLVGLFCPLFWVAYFQGASRGKLIFNAVHSGIFIFIGLLMILAGLMQP